MCDSFTEIEKAIYNTTKYGYKKKEMERTIESKHILIFIEKLSHYIHDS